MSENTKTEDEINTENQIQKYQQRIEELEKIVKAVSQFMYKSGSELANTPAVDLLVGTLMMSKNLITISKNTMDTAFQKDNN